MPSNLRNTTDHGVGALAPTCSLKTTVTGPSQVPSVRVDSERLHVYS